MSILDPNAPGEVVAAELRQAYGSLGGAELIAAMVGVFRGRIAVTSSFGAEAAVLLDLVAEIDPSLPVIFLDTGELFDETVAYRDTLQRRLGLTDLRVVRPRHEDLKAAEDLWRTDHDRCCALRKVRPLARALTGFKAVIDGRKRAHGFERSDLSSIEAGGGVIKISPLAEWSTDEITRAFIARDLPQHPLALQGYRSIGCWPCTRPTRDGEPARAGRWSGTGKSECGIHTLDLRDGAGI